MVVSGVDGACSSRAIRAPVVAVAAINPDRGALPGDERGHRALCHCATDCAHRKSPGVLTEIPHLMAGSVYRLAGTGGGASEAIGRGVVIA
jgi:hypothetical protein